MKSEQQVRVGNQVYCNAHQLADQHSRPALFQARTHPIAVVWQSEAINFQQSRLDCCTDGKGSRGGGFKRNGLRHREHEARRTKNERVCTVQHSRGALLRRSICAARCAWGSLLRIGFREAQNPLQRFQQWEGVWKVVGLLYGNISHRTPSARWNVCLRDAPGTRAPIIR